MKQQFQLLLIAAIVALSTFAFNQPTIITGHVKDQNGKALPFTTIMVKGTRTSISADNNGFYSIKTMVDNPTLVFTRAGYKILEIAAGSKTSINAVLERSNTDLQEVVVTSLGIQRQRKDMGYASSSSNNSYFAYPSPGLQGKVSGLAIANSPAHFIQEREDFNTEGYGNISENTFTKVTDEPLSTFSIDVDAASYSNMRRYLASGNLPPAGAVRIEEMINYFSYEYPAPVGDEPFSINTEMSDCPWNKNHKLVMIGLQGKKIPVQNLPASNLVFLIDVSGSMSDENKLPLVKASLKMLTAQLREQDRISLVVYAGNAGLVLPSTSGAEKIKIENAIGQLQSGGSTAGGQGIMLAYKTAAENFIKNGNNRVILCTDGDFNVGASSDDEMVRLIEKQRESGVYLTVLGYGTGNYQDNKMQQLADKGNGNHAYIDGINEAKKVLVNEFGGTLFTIAKDVKLQVEFNPAEVAGYRLIGYENRMLAKQDFNDDKKDAGELGSNHTVTALYEVIPAGADTALTGIVDPLKYQQNTKVKASASEELLTVKFRYKKPGEETSKLLSRSIFSTGKNITAASPNLRFASAVAGFGMILRNSKFKGTANYKTIYELAASALGTDNNGYRKEFLELVLKAEKITAAIAVK